MLLLIYYVIIQKTMSPRKSDVDVTIKFCQKQSFADILQNRCYYKIRKFHWQSTALEPHFNEVQNRLQHRCFPVKFCKFLRISFLQNTSGGEGTSLIKILQFCHFNIFGINHRCSRKMPIKKINE